MGVGDLIEVGKCFQLYCTVGVTGWFRLIKHLLTMYRD